MREMILLIFGLAFSFASSKQLLPPKAAKSGFHPVTSSKSNQGFYPLDNEEPIVEPAPKAQALAPAPKPTRVEEEIAEPTEPKEISLEDFNGVTVSGIPRLIRASPETEIFFRDVNTSYIIPKDSKHNPYYEAFDQAIRTGKSVSFRADPISRRVLAVDGVLGVRAPAKSPAGPGTSASSVPATPGSK